uniref:Uncharacterized protein n=1 Tax=Utricularia reniformis TaxID=192314 RepID=A0A1Y0B080_9LAMI|nr:hypothetical protein AEK19_MT0586 [Utricularia reniformis]ART30842.1 hypothetical protein AEK19_MT0586 [Utricularia reniformis]
MTLERYSLRGENRLFQVKVGRLRWSFFEGIEYILLTLYEVVTNPTRKNKLRALLRT